MDTTTRRKFLITGLATLVATGAGALLYPLLRYLSPAKNDGTKQRLTLQLSEIPAGGAKYFELNGTSGVLVKPKGGVPVVFSAVCTHLGCIVQWQKEKDQFLCPCHGGLFSPEGTVLAGPPPKPLQKLPFVLNGDSITIG